MPAEVREAAGSWLRPDAVKASINHSAASISKTITQVGVRWGVEGRLGK
jgi:hypothetical protein